MPTKTDYALHIIEATTQQPFKEHPGKDEIDAFVEVEPGLEYYIKIENYSETKVIIVHYEVDGKDLENSSTIDPENHSMQGFWSYDKESQRSKSTALKFSKLVSQPQRTHSHTQCCNENKATDVGIIKITIYEKIFQDGYHYMEPLESNFDDHNDTTTNRSKFQDKTNKFLCSQVGTNENDFVEDDGKRRNYIYGKQLEIIQVKYCTALGLIFGGVLPKPPLWDFHKMTYPQKRCDTKIDPIEPTYLKKETCDMNGNIIESKNLEMFDLTSFGTSSDSETDDTEM